MRRLALAGLTVAAGCAMGSRYELPPVHYASHGEVLPSGLRVVAYEFDTRLFSLAVSYRAGSSLDPPGREGTAALATRVISRLGGGGEDRLRHDNQLFAAGVRYGASSSRDAMEFVASGPVERLGSVLAVEAARLRDPLGGVTEEEFVRERDLLVEEVAVERLRATEETQLQWLLEAALPGKSYARPLRGSPESLRRVTLADLRTWVARHLAPASSVVALTGPLAPQEAVARVAQAFEGQRREPAADRAGGVPPEAPLPPESLERTAAKDPTIRTEPVEGARLWIGWLLPGSASRDCVRSRAAADVVDGMIARSARRSIDFTGTRLWITQGFTLLAAEVRLEQASDAAGVMHRLRAQRAPDLWAPRFFGPPPVSAEGMLNAQSLLLQAPQAAFFGEQLRLTGELNDPYLAWQRTVRRGLGMNLRDWVRDWLDPARAVALLIEPERERREPEQATVPGTDRLWATSLPLGPRLPPGDYDVLDLLRPPGLASAARSRLPSGLEVVVLRRPAFPVIDGHLVVRMPPSSAGGAPAALPWLALRAARDPASPAAEGFARDHFVVHAHGLAAEFAGLLTSLAAWGRELRADEHWVNVNRRTLLAALRDWGARPEFLAGKALLQGVLLEWGGAWDEAGIAKVDVSAANEWLRTEWRPDRATLVLVGDVPPADETFRAVERAFGGWRAPAATERPSRRPSATEAAGTPPVLVASVTGARTAQMWLGLRAPPLSGRDDAAAIAWLAEVGRVLARVRGASAAASVEFSSIDLAAGRSAFFFSAHCEAGRVAGTLRWLLEALGGTAAAPVSPDLAGMLRWTLAREFPFRFQTAADAGARLAEAAVAGREPDYWERYPASIASLDGARIQQFARSLSIGREVVVVLGDREVLEPQLRAAGFKVQLVEAPADPKKR